MIQRYGSMFLGIVIVLALIFTLTSAKQQKQESVAEKVIQSGTIRIGYIIYPPLLTKDSATGKLSGVSYDILEAAAKNLGLKTNWVEEVGWGTAIEGLKTKRYDMVGTQMWPNSARAREAIFSLSPINSVVFPYVRTNDKRFSENLPTLNSDQFTISALDGSVESFIAKDEFPKAKVNTLPQLSSFAEIFLNIVNNKADITFAEPSAANDFLKSNPGTIERIGQTPIRTFGNSFVFTRGEESMASMWNIALAELLNDGTVQRILEKYNVSADYVLNK